MTSIPPESRHECTSSTSVAVSRRSIANRRVIRRLHMCANRKLHSSELFDRSGPTYTSYHKYDGGESTSIPPALPHRGTSSTTATVPRRSIANRHVKRRLHMYASRKSGSSKLFRRSGPTYTPYHMMVESRPLYLLLCLIGAPHRLQQRYHDDPLATGSSIVVYTCMPLTNHAVASSLADQDQPTHHTI